MKFKQLIVATTIFITALSVQAAFDIGMTPAQIQSGIAAQQATGADAASMVGCAAAGDLSMSSLIEVLVTVPVINRAAAVSAAVRATPAAAVAIASAAATAMPQSAAAIASAVVSAAPQIAAATNAAVIALVPQVASGVTAAVQQAVVASATEPAQALVLPSPTITPTTQTVCSVSFS
jgi:hypothetical protein